jgi:PST family polysaccharide transporter
MKRYNNEALFEHIDENVKEKSAIGAISIFGSQVLSLAINVGSLTILARLLHPQQFGLIGMIMAIANFAFIFQDFGLSMATIQKKTITHEQVSSLFWLNIACGAFIMALLCIAAPLISSLYGHAELKWLTILISTAFLFSGMSVQHQALLKRRMAFIRLSIVRCFSLLLAHALCVLLAVWGAGVWALASTHVLTPFFMFMGCFLALPWYPSFPRKSTNIRELLGFGGNIVGFGVITYFSRNVDKILIGHALGPIVLGFYSKAYELMLLPLTRIRGPIIGVASSALSGLQDNQQAYHDYFLRFISLLSLIAIPLIAGLVISASEIIRIVLGEGWVPAIGIFRWLGIAGLCQPFYMALGTLLISLGRTRRYLIWGILHSGIIIFSFLLGLRGKAIGVAQAYAVANLILFIPSILYCTYGTYIRSKDLIGPIGQPLVSAVLATLATGLFISHLGELSIWLSLITKCIWFVSIYLGIILLLPSSRTTLFGTIRLVRRTVTI